MINTSQVVDFRAPPTKSRAAGVARHQRNEAHGTDCPKMTKQTASLFPYPSVFHLSSVDLSWILDIQPMTMMSNPSRSSEEMHQVETIVSSLTRDRLEAVEAFGSLCVPVCLSQLYHIHPMPGSSN
jgi:hypothetical protein